MSALKKSIATRRTKKTWVVGTLTALMVSPHAQLQGDDSSIDIRSAPRLGVPVSCDFSTGHKCWISNYPDHDMGKGIADYRCLSRTYNVPNRFGMAHQGTDFAALDWRHWNSSSDQLTVVAAADGTVLRLRDGVQDRRSLDKAPGATACGNAVVLDHGQNWQSSYCHLKKNSIAVKVGDKVTKGDVLGLMGSSGFSSYPHLHFMIGLNGPDGFEVIDPFSATRLTESCSLYRGTLWDASAAATFEYAQAHMVKIGFVAAEPSPEDLLFTLRARDTLSWSETPNLSVFAYFSGAAEGDFVRFRVLGPDGHILLKSTAQLSGQPSRRRLFSALKGAKAIQAIKKNGTPLPTGRFQLRVDIATQQGQIYGRHQAEVTITE